MSRIRHFVARACSPCVRWWRRVEAYEPGPKARLLSYLGFCILVIVVVARLQVIAHNNKESALRNCHRIELVKQYIRETVAYNDDEYKVRLLREGIIPNSALGKARRAAAAQVSNEIQTKFAATPC